MKALVLLSGGLDSATALAWAIDTWGKEEVGALAISYGQKHSKELVCAQQVAKHYEVPLKHIVLPDSIWADSDCTLLKGRDEIDESTYAEQIEKSDGPIATSVPFRNGVFLSIAAAQAMSRGCQHLVIGVHQDDNEAAYPDCDEIFLDYMGRTILNGTDDMVDLEAPFGGLTKDEIVKWGLGHHVPYELTWSCYNGREKACGKCATCRDRLKAFAKNGVMDPIEYEEEN